MPREPLSSPPRTFFLNEQHELSHAEKPSGGGLPKLAPIDWPAKSKRIHDSLVKAQKVIKSSIDPLRESRYFLATLPTPTVSKLSTNLKKAPDGYVYETTDYSREHSLVFRRLGLDLLSVDHQGRALVHAPVARVEQLMRTAENLKSEGKREQARWVTIDSFEAPHSDFRIDAEWLDETRAEKSIDTVVELQPLLTRVEVEQTMQGIIDALGMRSENARFTGTGTDFSGRHWYRGKLSHEALKLIAGSFYSVQSLHRPIHTPVALASTAKGPRHKPSPVVSMPTSVDPTTLPCVAVVDTGVPQDHLLLHQYRRGEYQSPDKAWAVPGDHGAFVASRIVFGDPDSYEDAHSAEPGFTFFDVNVGEGPNALDDKALLPAMEAVIATHPDVRVFNLSFGDHKPLNAYPAVERREKLYMLQDLDNFAFARDVVVVIAAGNSIRGIIPNPGYPKHVNVEEWALGSWACGFNTIKCGSYVARPSPDGPVKNIGWPSPFTRIGPGLCDAPVPEFGAHGGNCTANYQYAQGLGVWGCNSSGLWEDRPGTSFAAPLLAREAATAMTELQRRCERGARPFAATVKAFLVLTAELTVKSPTVIRSLADRTIGRGKASAKRLTVPSGASAVMIWQGILNDPDDIARVQIPIPRSWLSTASRPVMRLVCAWESPVNQAVVGTWASRKVKVQLRPTPNDKAVPPATRKSHRSYPSLDRRYDLSETALNKKLVTPPQGDFWNLDISYEQIADYQPTMDFSPHQRVGFSIEILDEGEVPQSPQAAIQALPQSITMTRLTIPENRIANPVLVRPRI